MKGTDGHTPSTAPPSTAVRRRPRGRNDPQRPERIVQAAIDVIVTSGIEGLSHRVIARQAGVPLGSTTYYFESLDDIVVAATRKAIEDDTAVINAWAAGIRRKGDLVPALASRIIDEAAHRERSIAYYRLYLGAAVRPELQDLAYRWARVMTEVLERFVDAETAETLSALYDALVMRVLIMGGRVTQHDVQRILRVVVEGSPAST